MLKHFVVTRAGLGNYDERWYEHALNVFEAITLPSLSQQTSRDFEWFLVVDSEMPGIARARLERLLNGNSNYHMVPLDITELRRVGHAGLDWVFEPCREYILRNGLIADPTDYVITSMIDIDDGWHREVVSAVRAAVSEHLPLVCAKEADRPATIRHSAGLAITFPLGWQWFIPVRAVHRLWSPFHSMAVFVAHRFSAGISALTMRHHKWEAYADIIEFTAVELLREKAMWIYSRHQGNIQAWQCPPPPVIDTGIEQIFAEQFGVDLAKANRLIADTGSKEPSSAHLGHQNEFRDQLDCLHRIAALNCEIDVLGRESRNSWTYAAEGQRSFPPGLVEEKKLQRAALIEQLRELGHAFSGESVAGQA